MTRFFGQFSSRLFLWDLDYDGLLSKAVVAFFNRMIGRLPFSIFSCFFLAAYFVIVESGDVIAIKLLSPAHSLEWFCRFMPM